MSGMIGEDGGYKEGGFGHSKRTKRRMFRCAAVEAAATIRKTPSRWSHSNVFSFWEESRSNADD
jgi:hypothetical protein